MKRYKWDIVTTTPRVRRLVGEAHTHKVVRGTDVVMTGPYGQCSAVAAAHNACVDMYEDAMGKLDGLR